MVVRKTPKFVVAFCARLALPRFVMALTASMASIKQSHFSELNQGPSSTSSGEELGFSKAFLDVHFPSMLMFAASAV